MKNIIPPSFPEACCTLDISGTEQEKLIAMFKALGNPIRFEVMKFLVTHPGCITGDIVDYLPIAQATVSQHLALLKNKGIIEGQREGVEVYYHVVSKEARRIVQSLFEAPSEP